jgi:hypothetical protein
MALNNLWSSEADRWHVASGDAGPSFQLQPINSESFVKSHSALLQIQQHGLGL